MIHTGKISLNVGFQDIGVLAHELAKPPDGAVCPFASTAGIRIGNETALEDGLKHIAQGMVHDAVAKWRRTDQAPNRVLHVEATVGSRGVGLGGELFLKLDEM